MTEDERDSREEPERRKEKTGEGKTGEEKTGEKRPLPAGPHSKPELTNDDATPGAGIFPDETSRGEVDGGGG